MTLVVRALHQISVGLHVFANQNENLKTGDIEVIATSLRILSESQTPPFAIEENSQTKEDIRLKYRYLDLRRPDIQKNLMLKSRVLGLMRQFMANEGFLEIETPILCTTNRAILRK